MTQRSAVEARDFEAFARRQIPPLLRSARLLAGPELAEDLVQDTLLKAARNWPRIAGMANPEGYAYRILVNHYLSQRRRQVETGPMPDDLASNAPDVDERVGQLDTLRRALDVLPPRQRAAVVLRHYLDFDTPTIASTMRIRESTVRSLTARALTTLRHQLNPTEGDPRGHLSARS